MKEKNKNIPALRFKEFSKEWKKGFLGDIIKSLDAGVSVNSLDRPAQKNEKGILKTSAVSLGVFNAAENKLVNSILEIERLKEPVRKNTIIISRMNTPALVGANSFISKDNNNLFLPDRLWAAKISKNHNAHWLSILVATTKTRSIFSARATGTSNSMKNITKGDIFTTPAHYPSKKEQDKISSFMSSVDTSIEQLTKEKKLLEQYKKGMMQKFFSQKIRFKDDEGNDFSEWEEKKLGEMAKLYDGTHQTPRYVEKGIPFYSVEHVTANQFEKTKFISEEVFEKENKRVKLEKGDVLMTRIGSIGVSKNIDWDVEASFYVSLVLIKQSEKFNSSFLDQAIKSNYFQKELWKRTIHVAFPQKINLGEIGECKLLLPVKEEQQKIASFLSSLDDQINQIDQELQKVQTFKKGLLQKMFV